MATKIKQQKIKNEFQMDDAKKIALVVLAVVLVFAIFLFITMVITKEPKKDENTETVISYDKILISKLLSQSEPEYYVLVRNKKEVNDPEYSAYISTYKAKTDITPLAIYTAYLDDAFNEGFYSETSNLVSSPVMNIKFSQTTLVKVSNSQAIEYYEGYETIVNKLSELVK